MLLFIGFQRHVCNYTVRSILRLVLSDYRPPLDAVSVPLNMLDQLHHHHELHHNNDDHQHHGDDTMKIVDDNDGIIPVPVKPEFDQAIPLIMQCVLDDLIGGSQDDRDVDDAVRSLIREAKGSKANDLLEITAKCLLFRPTYALLALDDPASISSIHAITMPLLNVLQDSHQKRYGDIVGRVAEGLQRVALGLSKNPSIQSKEVLLYLHSTLQPFVAAIARDFMIQREALGKLTSMKESVGTKRKIHDNGGVTTAIKGSVTSTTTTTIALTNDYDDFDALDSSLPSYLREDSSDDEDKALYAPKSNRRDDVSGYKARTWLPSEKRSLLEQRAVIEARNREARLRIQVLDGASAPKLTGYNRVTSSRSNTSSSKAFNALQGTGGDRATLIAIRFCLTFLHSCLRRNKFDYADEEIQSMAIPFLPLLGKCIQLSTASNIVALAVKCLITFISWGIPVEASFITA